MVLLGACADRDELTTGAGMRLPQFEEFEAADTDHSGKLTREEAQAVPLIARFFDRIDTDRNGLVSWQEMRHLDLDAKRLQRPD